LLQGRVAEVEAVFVAVLSQPRSVRTVCTHSVYLIVARRIESISPTFKDDGISQVLGQPALAVRGQLGGGTRAALAAYSDQLFLLLLMRAIRRIADFAALVSGIMKSV
jgi:hypothetical protein